MGRKLKDSAKEFAAVLTWGTHRLEVFEGKCPRIDKILKPKYQRKIQKMNKAHKAYLLKMKTKFQKLVGDLMAKTMVMNEIDSKWKSKLKFSPHDLIAAAVKKAKTEPKLVLSYILHKAELLKARSQRRDKRLTKRRKMRKLLEALEKKRLAANTKMETNEVVHIEKEAKKESHHLRKKLAEVQTAKLLKQEAKLIKHEKDLKAQSKKNKTDKKGAAVKAKKAMKLALKKARKALKADRKIQKKCSKKATKKCKKNKGCTAGVMKKCLSRLRKLHQKMKKDSAAPKISPACKKVIAAKCPKGSKKKCAKKTAKKCAKKAAKQIRKAEQKVAKKAARAARKAKKAVAKKCGKSGNKKCQEVTGDKCTKDAKIAVEEKKTAKKLAHKKLAAKVKVAKAEAKAVMKSAAKSEKKEAKTFNSVSSSAARIVAKKAKFLSTFKGTQAESKKLQEDFEMAKASVADLKRVARKTSRSANRKALKASGVRQTKKQKQRAKLALEAEKRNDAAR